MVVSMEQKVVIDLMKKVTIPSLNQELLELEQEFQTKLKELEKTFYNEFINLCLELKYQQQQGKLGKLAYIGLILLRTEILEKNFQYKVIAYEEEWLLKDGLEIGWVDLTFIYSYLEKVWQTVSLESKKYVGKFSEPYIELIMSTVLCYFHEYAVQYLRSGITECILSEEYNEVAKDEEICIYTGELYEKIDIVWKENNRNKSLYEVKRLIEEKEQMEFYDFKGMELGKLDFSLMNLSYADFSRLELIGLTFSNSSLRGVKFKNSTLAEVNFMGSSLQEADFRQAEVTDVNFMFAEFTRGIENYTVWKKAGYLPVKFDGARLTRVNFTSARLQQIDFSKAVLSEVNFEGAELEQCIFHASQLKNLELSDKQKQGSIIITS